MSAQTSNELHNAEDDEGESKKQPLEGTIHHQGVHASTEHTSTAASVLTPRPDHGDLRLTPPFRSRASSRTHGTPNSTIYGDELGSQYEAPPYAVETPPHTPNGLSPIHSRIEEIDGLEYLSPNSSENQSPPAPHIPLLAASYPSLPAYYRGITDQKVTQLIDALAEPSLGGSLHRVAARIPPAANTAALQTLEKAWTVLKPRKGLEAPQSPNATPSATQSCTSDDSPLKTRIQSEVQPPLSSQDASADLKSPASTTYSPKMIHTGSTIISPGDEAKPVPTSGFAVTSHSHIQRLLPPSATALPTSTVSSLGEQGVYLTRSQTRALAQEKWRQQERHRASRIQNMLQDMSHVQGTGKKQTAQDRLYSLSGVLHDPSAESQSYLSYYYNHYIWGVSPPETLTEIEIPDRPELSSLSNDASNPALLKYTKTMGASSEVLAKHIRRTVRSRARTRRLAQQRANREMLQQQITERLITEKLEKLKAEQKLSPALASAHTESLKSNARIKRGTAHALPKDKLGSSLSHINVVNELSSGDLAQNSHPEQPNLDPSIMTLIQQEAEIIAEKEAVSQTVGVPLDYLQSNFSLATLPFLNDISHEPLLPWEQSESSLNVSQGSTLSPPSSTGSSASHVATLSPPHQGEHGLEETLAKFVDAVEAQLQTQATAKAHLFARALDSIEVLCESANEQRKLVVDSRTRIRAAETALATSSLSTLLLQRKQARLLGLVRLLESLAKVKMAPMEIRAAISEQAFNRAVSIAESTAQLLAGPLVHVNAAIITRTKVAEAAFLLGGVLVNEAISLGFAEQLESHQQISKPLESKRSFGTPTRNRRRVQSGNASESDGNISSNSQRDGYEENTTDDDNDSSDFDDDADIEDYPIDSNAYSLLSFDELISHDANMDIAKVGKNDDKMHTASDYLLLTFHMGIHGLIEEPLANVALEQLGDCLSQKLANILSSVIEERLNVKTTQVTASSNSLFDTLGKTMPKECVELLSRCSSPGERYEVLNKSCKEYFSGEDSLNNQPMSPTAKYIESVKKLNQNQTSTSPQSEVFKAPSQYAQTLISSLIAHLDPKSLHKTLKLLSLCCERILSTLLAFVRLVRESAASSHKPDLSLFNLWTSSPSAVSAQKSANVKIIGGSTSTVSDIQLSMKRILKSVSECAHMLLAKLLTSYSLTNQGVGAHTLTLMDTRQIFDLCLDFIAESEELTEGHSIYGLRGATLALAKVFLNTHHSRLMSRLALQLDKETWTRVDIPVRLQDIVCREYGSRKRIQRNSSAGDSSMPNSLDALSPKRVIYAIVYPTLFHTFPPPKVPYQLPPEIVELENELLSEMESALSSSTAQIASQNNNQGVSPTSISAANDDAELRKSSKTLYAAPFPIVNSVLRVIGDLRFYIAAARRIPPIAATALSKVLELVKLFNSRTCQLVLGAGAMRTAGLKAITATQLALAAQSVGFVATQLSTAKTVFQGLLPIRQRNLTTPLNLLERDLLNHRQETLLKLPDIVGSLVDAACKRMSTSPWAAIAQAQSRGWIRRHAEAQNKYSKLVATGLAPSAALEAIKRQLISNSVSKEEQRFQNSASSPTVSNSPPDSPYSSTNQIVSGSNQDVNTEFEFIPGKPLTVFGYDVTKISPTAEDEDTGIPDAPISALAKQLTSLHRALTDILTFHDRDMVMTEVARLCSGLLFRYLSKFDLSHPVAQIRVHANASFVLNLMQDLTGNSDICRELKVFILFDETMEVQSDSETAENGSTSNTVQLSDTKLSELESKESLIEHPNFLSSGSNNAVGFVGDEDEDFELEYEEDVFEEEDVSFSDQEGGIGGLDQKDNL